MQEPFLSIGHQFSAEGWVHGAADVLRGKLNDADQVTPLTLHLLYDPPDISPHSLPNI